MKAVVSNHWSVDRLSSRPSRRAPAGRGTPAVIKRFVEGVAEEEIRSTAEPLDQFGLQAVVARRIAILRDVERGDVVERLDQTARSLRAAARLHLVDVEE